jgi:hypothetical protein
MHTGVIWQQTDQIAHKTTLAQIISELPLTLDKNPLYLENQECLSKAVESLA